MEKNRYGSVAALLHLLAPGLGFLYAGRMRLAIFVPLFLFAFIFFMGWSRLILQPWGVWAIWTVLLGVYLLLLPWVFVSVRKSSPQRLGRFQSTPLYTMFTLILFALGLLMLDFREQLLGYETFRLPSRSMANTLLPNDFIIVDTWGYDEEEPERGDILVFKYPLQPQTWFTKRLLAKADETITIRQGKVIVNQQLIDEPYVLAEHNIKTAQQDYAAKKVQQGYLFVLGDNRDFSNDSRMWGGLKAAEVYGKATAIWLSVSAREGIRFDRIRSLLY